MIAERHTLEERLSAVLGVPVALAIVSHPLPPEEMTPGERGAFERLPPSEVRRAEWRRGRTALREVLARLGREPDTALLAWPHPSVSVAHDPALAVAVGRSGGDGIGVDVEPLAPLREQTARFFLTPAERDRVADGEQLLRAWTVKEAVFKADAANNGLYLHDYLLDDASARSGLARRPGAGVWRYASCDLLTPAGARTIAVAVAAAPAPRPEVARSA